MTIYVTSDLCSLRGLDSEDSAWRSLGYSTAVFRGSTGEVGFRLREAKSVFRLLAVRSIVMEIANSPEWFELDQMIAAPSDLFGRFMNPVACHEPDQFLRDELRKVRRNQTTEKKNRVLARHSRPSKSFETTLFDSWVGTDGNIRGSAAPLILNHCGHVCMWLHSTWGLFVQILAKDQRSVESVVEALVRESGCVRIDVPSAASLPEW